jgi:crossover junction endodeoxyribonuclease RusA
MLTVTFVWPFQELSQNARKHWAVVAKAKKQYRALCGWAAKEAGAKKITADCLRVHLEFYPPDRRKRDEDNMVAAMKSGLDGLADALGVDDSIFRLTHSVNEQIGGYVKVTVREVQP